MGRFKETVEAARKDPSAFWLEAAKAVAWSRPCDQVLDESAAPFYRWFPGAELNTCFNALDRHVAAGHGERTAIIYDSPAANTRAKISYTELKSSVERCAGALAQRGVSRGDRVIIYMSMTPDAVVAMLACARLGAIHSVVFGGFAANELAKRIDDAEPVAIVASSCGIEPGRIVHYQPLLEEALKLSRHQPRFCLVRQRDQGPAALQEGRDVDWDTALAEAPAAPCTAVAATDPLYILYTSGTTGSPKGVVRDNGGHAVAMTWSMRHIYGMQPGDVFWAASDVGWVVGHSYIVYAPLLLGCTTVIYEGKPVGTPDPGAFFRVIDDYGVKVLFTAPTAFRAIKREDPEGKFVARASLASLEALFLAGERCDPDTMAWAGGHLGVPVIDHWWQTETGWTIAGIARGIELLPVKPGSAGLPMPGYDVVCLDARGQELPAGEIGSIAIRLPLPPGTLPTLWQDDKRYIVSYLERYPGCYLTGDAGYLDEDGYLFVMSRIDDVINVAGHRLSTGAMEEVLAEHPAVAECAVIGAADELKGQLPVGLVVLKNGVDMRPDALENELIASVRQRIGPVAAFRKAIVVERLPKTRSGKVLRNVIRRLADGEDVATPPTIDDPRILDEIRHALAQAGFAGKQQHSK